MDANQIAIDESGSPPVMRISISYAGLPQLKEALSRKEMGKTCTLEVTFQLDQRDEERAGGIVESVSPEGYEEEGEKEIETDSDSPVMLAMAGGNAAA